MNRSLLFIIGTLIFVLAACANNNGLERDPVIINSYEIGRIELAPNAYLAEVDNLVFTRDGETVDPAELIPEMWYQFSKDDPKWSGSFFVITDRSVQFENSTHIQVAKQSEGQNICPKWALAELGIYCESYAISIH